MNRLQTNPLSLPASSKDKTKDWQLEILMEKLRSKAAQYKSLPEISKNVRMTLLEKRYALDSVEKSQHQKCLDTLQHSIKVTSLQSMVERLESLTRQLGLKFVVEPAGVFISSDMFYLEIVLEPSGAVKDVKIHHEGKMEQQSCIELVNCLSKGDFADFTAQLEGFTSIYQLNAEKKVKCKAFIALESLESDLSTLAQLQMFMKEPFNLIHKSPVGVLEKRKGGHPMKLRYFVTPYDLINVEKGDMEPINVETIINKNLGYSVTVCMEGSAAHKLQTTTLITVNRNVNGKCTPSYSSLNSQNSAVIPACFVLKLNKPMPMCISLVRRIQQIQPWPEVDGLVPQPLLNLIVTHCSEGKMSSGSNRGLFVTLPDQDHCYFLTENKNMNGILINSIPFTYPAHVPNILNILREQALFNTIIGSCVRPNSRQDFENMTMFEVSALSSTQLSISLEHPLEETIATAEINLSDISNLVCQIHNPGSPPPMNVTDVASELATKILNKCFSLPVTLRAIIKLWEKQSLRRNHFGGHENFSLPLGSGDPGGHKEEPGAGLTDFGNLNDKIKQEPSSGSGHGVMMQTNQGLFLNESMMASNFQNFPPSDGVLTNELTNILSDVSDKSSKRHRHKLNEDLWKSGKRKVGIEDSELTESSSSDSTSRSTPFSQETEITTPNSILGFQTDLELSGFDTTELLNDKNNLEFNNLDDIVDDEEMSNRSGREQTPTNIVEFSEKGIVTSSISITPIPSSPSSDSMKDKRSSLTNIPVPSSITITPITKPSEEKSKDRKSSRSSKDDRSRLEKKRKRKRDDSPMGPPEKVPTKQDPLNKPVTVSIKPAESPPQTPTSPSMMRKFTPSPTPNRSITSLSGKLSPNLLKSNLKTQSPKHSPAHIPSSPKHGIPSVSSPKHHGTSPKHISGAGSGKPSMSTLKSAANSPSGKNGGGTDLKNRLKDNSRDKDKKFSAMFGNSNKNKGSSSVKVKPLDLNSGEITMDGLPSPSGDPLKSNHIRSRKSSLSAIVDKLKVNAQHCDIMTDMNKSSSSGNIIGNRDRLCSSITKSGELGKSGIKVGETKNSEYMVKPSSDGMKITINKTRTKDSSSTKSSSSSSLGKTGSCTGSPKSHTGLKPGVNSGPASKKPQQLQKSVSSPVSNSYAISGIKSSNSTNKPSGVKPVSMGIPKSLSKGGSMVDLSRSKDRLKPSKSSSEKSIFSSLKDRKSSPTSNREEAESIYKLSQASLMEGMMKTLDKNFQIPKLSARIDDKKVNKSDQANNRSTVDTKIFEMMQKTDLQISKYPIAVPSEKIFENSMDSKIRNINNLNELSGSGSIETSEDKKKDLPQNFSTSQQSKEEPYNTVSKPYPISTVNMDPLMLTNKSIDLTTKFIAPVSKEESKKDLRKNDEALDFSSKPQMFPPSPSVSVHIVKSPSPLVNPSPRSAASPCITDDELMDEALVGLGK